MSTSQNKKIFFQKLAFNLAEINIGSTSSNPSVGCVVEKNGSVISSGFTSLNGRPHAEFNALNKKIDFRNSSLHVSLEPCSHYGLTPPCTNIIINKKVKKVYFSVKDFDPRSKNKSINILNKSKINTNSKLLNNFGLNFYKSFSKQFNNQLPIIDCKIALSKDLYSINKSKKWITNQYSRRLGNFFRSKYDCLLTTYKTINEDNPLLDCRIENLEKKSPSIVILDRYFKIKKNLRLLKNKNSKIYLLTFKKNSNKANFFSKNGVKVIYLKKTSNNNNLKEIFFLLKKLKFYRIFVESGLTFINALLNQKLINKFFIFKSSEYLRNNGKNTSEINYVKRLMSNKNKVLINLKGDSLYQTKTQ